MCLKTKTCCMLSSNLFGVEKGQGAWYFVGEVFLKHGSSFLEQTKLRRNNRNYVELWLLELCACHSWWFMIYVSNPLIIEDFVATSSSPKKKCKQKDTKTWPTLSKPLFFHSTAEATSLTCLGHLRQEDSKAAERTAREALSMFQVGGGWM